MKDLASGGQLNTTIFQTAAGSVIGGIHTIPLGRPGERLKRLFLALCQHFLIGP
jgi:hypothetical protein